jgi:hypothetical protein
VGSQAAEFLVAVAVQTLAVREGVRLQEESVNLEVNIPISHSRPAGTGFP